MVRIPHGALLFLALADSLISGALDHACRAPFCCSNGIRIEGIRCTVYMRCDARRVSRLVVKHFWTSGELGQESHANQLLLWMEVCKAAGWTEV
jgi:hypothetical protein